MADLGEWAKGITFGIFMVILFYFYWDNIFLGIINFIGDFSLTGVTDATSIAVLKTLAWVSFSALFIMSVPVYIYYSILVGSQGNNKTSPIEIFKGVGLWLIIMPVILFIYVVLASLNSSLIIATNTTMSAENVDLAGQFSWLIGLIIIAGASVIPFYYVLKGYGQFGGTETNG